MKRLGWILAAVCLLMGILPGKVQGVTLEVPAKSAVLMDVETGTLLYESNGHTQLAPASVTKVMTML